MIILIISFISYRRTRRLLRAKMCLTERLEAGTCVRTSMADSEALCRKKVPVTQGCLCSPPSLCASRSHSEISHFVRADSPIEYGQYVDGMFLFLRFSYNLCFWKFCLVAHT